MLAGFPNRPKLRQSNLPIVMCSRGHIEGVSAKPTTAQMVPRSRHWTTRDRGARGSRRGLGASSPRSPRSPRSPHSPRSTRSTRGARRGLGARSMRARSGPRSVTVLKCAGSTHTCLRRARSGTRAQIARGPRSVVDARALAACALTVGREAQRGSRAPTASKAHAARAARSPAVG